MITAKRKVSLILFVFFILKAVPCYSDYRGYGITVVPDYNKLLESPVEIKKEFNKSASDNFSIITDYHMLLPCSTEKLINLLTDLDSSENIFPRMASSDVYYHAYSPEEIYYQRIKTDFETLGFGKKYDYSVKVFFDESDRKSLKMRWALNESYDKSFSVFKGSWYCCEITIDNKKYTYIRNYTETEMLNPGFITIFAVKHFTESEIKKVFKSLSTAVQ